MDMVCNGSVPLPARAIRMRLMASTELPSWASYLPFKFLGMLQATGDRCQAEGGAGMCTDGHHCGEGSEPRIITKDLATINGADGFRPLAQVAGRVWALARDPRGCREVQRALEVAGSDEARSALANELRGHVWEAMRCPHANHVLQKCIVSMRPQQSQFIIDELLCGTAGPSGASQAARHRYGCRIVERLIEHCPPQQVKRLVEDLVSDAVALSKHPYGNYVMQHLLEHGPPDQRRRLTRMLELHAHTAGSDCYARAVVSKALSHGAHADQVALARALLREPGLIATMARTRHGHVAAKFVLQNLEGQDSVEARRQLTADLAVLRASRYGRFVAACLSPPEGKSFSAAMHHHINGDVPQVRTGASLGAS